MSRRRSGGLETDFHGGNPIWVLVPEIHPLLQDGLKIGKEENPAAAAVEMAAAMAGVSEDFKVRYYPIQKTSLEELMETFSSSNETRVLKSELGELYPYLELINDVKTIHGIQARMPYEIEW